MEIKWSTKNTNLIKRRQEKEINKYQMEAFKKKEQDDKFKPNNTDNDIKGHSL